MIRVTVIIEGENQTRIRQEAVDRVHAMTNPKGMLLVPVGPSAEFFFDIPTEREADDLKKQLRRLSRGKPGFVVRYFSLYNTGNKHQDVALR